MDEAMAAGSNLEEHTIAYRILNHDLKDPVRRIAVKATKEEIDLLSREGYLVRERLFQGEALEQLRAALDELAARERDIKGPGEGLSTSRRYGGLFLRHLHEKHPLFLNLIQFPPIISVARAMLGPQINLRGFTARITYPGQSNQETHWHQHHRVIPTPLPPWFVRPQTLDALIYLDDINDATGPLCVVPGTHQRILEDVPADCYDELPGQQTLHLTAGSMVLMHAGLWHRAMPTTSQGTIRRLLLFGYAPAWLRRSPYGTPPEKGLTQSLRETSDPELKELLGMSGWT